MLGNGIGSLNGFERGTKKRLDTKSLSLSKPLFVNGGRLYKLERAIADESFPLGGGKWRGTLGKNAVHLLDDKVDVGINVHLPWRQGEVLKFSSNLPLDFGIPEGTFGKEDFGVGDFLLVAGEKSNIDGGENVVILEINLLDTFGFPSFAPRRLNGGKVKVVVCVGHENGVLEPMVDKNIVNPPLRTIGMFPRPRFIGLPFLKCAWGNEFVRGEKPHEQRRIGVGLFGVKISNVWGCLGTNSRTGVDQGNDAGGWLGPAVEEFGERGPPFLAFSFWPTCMGAVTGDNVDDKKGRGNADDHPAAVEVAMPKNSELIFVKTMGLFSFVGIGSLAICPQLQVSTASIARSSNADNAL